MKHPFKGISRHGVYGRKWREFLRDFWREVSNDNVFNGAAALAYFLTLAIFPAMILLLTLIPYLPIPHMQETVFEYFYNFLPEDTAKMFSDTVLGIVGKKRSGLLSVGFILTVWAASSGLYALMQQLNITYGVKEERSFIKGRTTALLLTIGFGVLTFTSLTLIIVGGNIQAWLLNIAPWDQTIALFYSAGRWLYVVTALSMSFSIVYYFGPNVKQEFRFVTPGSVVGVLLLLGVSFLFKFYVQNFGNYNATYGSIGAVIVLMLWLNIFGLVILCGSEVNKLLEHYSPEGKAEGQKIPA